MVVNVVVEESLRSEQICQVPSPNKQRRGRKSVYKGCLSPTPVVVRPMLFEALSLGEKEPEILASTIKSSLPLGQRFALKLTSTGVEASSLNLPDGVAGGELGTSESGHEGDDDDDDDDDGDDDNNDDDDGNESLANDTSISDNESLANNASNSANSISTNDGNDDNNSNDNDNDNEGSLTTGSMLAWPSVAPSATLPSAPLPSARSTTEEASRDRFANSSPPRGALGWVGTAAPGADEESRRPPSPTLAQVLAEGFVASPRSPAGAGERSDAPPQPQPLSSSPPPPPPLPPPPGASGPSGAQHARSLVDDDDDTSLFPALLTPAVVLHMGRGWAGYPPESRAAVEATAMEAGRA